MTWEESAEFVKQSIESHDRQLGELFEAMARTDAKIDRLTIRMDANAIQVEALTARLDNFIASSQLNFDRLTQAMLGLTEHAGHHAKRIARLEGERE